MGSNPDLKTRSPLKKGATTLFCFLTGRKRMTKKRYYYSTDIKRNFVPRKRIYLSKFVSSQLFILAAKSCAELLEAGFTDNGVYKIFFNNSQVFDVYCDQSSRGGGNIKKKLYLIMHDRIWRTMRLKKRSHAFWSLLFSYALDVLLVFMMRFRYPFGLFPRPPPPQPLFVLWLAVKTLISVFFRHSIEKVLSDVHICKKWRKGERLHRQPIKLIFKHERWHPRHEKPPFLVHFRL